MKKHLYLLLIPFLVAIACKDDDNQAINPDLPEVTTGENTGTAAIAAENSRLDAVLSSQTMETNLVVKVTDTQGNPITSTISVGDETFTSNGKTLLENITIPLDFAVVKAQAPGFVDGILTFNPTSNGINMVALTLVPSPEMQSFEASEGSTFSYDGVTFTFPPFAIADQNGDLYQGDVQVYATYYDPNSSTFAQTSPGTLVGLNNQDTLGALVSKGMLKVVLQDPSGNTLEIFEGQTVAMVMPASANDPESIALWHLNEDHGIWVEEGVAIKVGETYEASVPHFSTYNLDVFADSMFFTLEIVDENGIALTNQQGILEVTTSNGDLVRYFYTDNLGHFNFQNAPEDGSYTISILSECDGILSESAINIEADTVNTVAFDLSSERLISLMGTLLECNTAMYSNKAFSLSFDTNGDAKTVYAYADNIGNYNSTSIFCNFDTTSSYDALMTIFDENQDISKSFDVVFDSDILTYNFRVCPVDGDVVIEEVEERIFDGDILIDNDTDYQTFVASSYTEVTGDLTIRNVTFTTFLGLESLVSVGGTLTIEDNENLQSLESLIAMEQVNGLLVQNNVSLINFEGLQALHTIGNSGFSILGNHSMIDVQGLDSLTMIEGDLNIGGENSIASLSGFSTLNNIGGDLTIGSFVQIIFPVPYPGPYYVNSFTNLDGLHNVNSLGGSLRIGWCYSLSDISAIQSLLTEINGDLYLTQLSMSNFDAFQNLTAIHGNFQFGEQNLNYEVSLYFGGNHNIIDFNGFTNLSFIQGDLIIVENPELISLDGLEALTTIGGDITIQDNGSLTDYCALTSVINNGLQGEYLPEDYDNPYYYGSYNNAYNPSQQDIINGNCSQ